MGSEGGGYGDVEGLEGSEGIPRRQVPDSSQLPLTLDNFGPHDEVLFGRPSHMGGERSSCNHHFIVTRSTIDRLVLETLAVIRTLVDK